MYEDSKECFRNFFIQEAGNMDERDLLWEIITGS
jgi:hypothetical protein